MLLVKLHKTRPAGFLGGACFCKTDICFARHLRENAENSVKMQDEYLNIAKNHQKEKMTLAVDTLLDDYKYDKDLIAFTQIDYEAFYEAR